MSAGDETRALRLLFIASDKFPPFRVDVSVLFGEELAGRGHRIDWLLQSERPCARDYETQWRGGRAWVGRTDLGTSRAARLRKHWYSLRHDFKLWRMTRGGRYDVVQVKDKFLSAILAAVAARRHGGRFVYWLSYPFPEASLIHAREGTARYPLLYRVRGWVLKWLLYKVILPRAAHVFVQSEQMKRDVAAQGIDPARMTAVPMGVSLEMFPPAEAPAPAPAAPPRIVYLGTLARLRRIDFLVRVLARVREQVPDAELHLVGGSDDPADERALRGEAARLGLAEHVVITGNRPRAEALALTRAATVCASPFYPTPVLNSTSPTKLIEYMALRKAVVANDHPEQRLVIDQSGAGLCVPYEEQPFADALAALIRDPRRAAEMGRRGRAYVERERAYPRIADRVEEQYRRIVGAPRARGAQDAAPRKVGL